MKSLLCLVFLIALLALSPAALASSPPEDEMSGEKEIPDKLEISIAATSTEDETAATIGIRYEHRLSRLLGVGGIVEHAGGSIGSTSTIGEVFFHPYAGFRFSAGIGIQFRDEDDNEFIGRAGFGYEFEFRLVTVIPDVDFDFVDGEVDHVYGVSLGFPLK